MRMLTVFQTEFARKINHYLDQKISYAKKFNEKGSEPIAIIKEFVANGGKRFRPALFYYAYSSYSQINLTSVYTLSFVFELFHTFGLIHDDIIDNSDSRRGYPTVHTKYDIPTAIMVGDISLMLTDELFFEGLSSIELNHDQKSKIMAAYNSFKQETFIGEYLDYVKIDDYMKVAVLKTAFYSFVRPVEIGLLMAQVDNTVIQKWKIILEKLGLLFQIKDDYIGTFADEKKIGKSVTSDVAEGKNTMIVHIFKLKASVEEVAKFDTFFGEMKVGEEDFTWYLNLLRKYKVDKEIETYIEKAIGGISVELAEFENNDLVELTKEVILHIKDFSSMK